MLVEDRVTELWHVLRGDTRRGAILRRRATAMGAMAAFFLALLAAIGFLWLVLLVFAVVAFGGSAVAAGILVRHFVPQLVMHRGSLRTGAARLGRVTSRAAGDARRAGLLVNSRVAGAADQAARQLQAARANVRPPSNAWPVRASDDVLRDAVRANSRGSELRRAGAYAEAVEQHRLALELYRSAGDRRAEALTLNNLALALDRVGDPAALGHFEEAATILGELGEEEREGQVIANLALAFRRRGRAKQSGEVLDVALGKLDPNSHEYRKLEELRRAS